MIWRSTSLEDFLFNQPARNVRAYNGAEDIKRAFKCSFKEIPLERDGNRLFLSGSGRKERCERGGYEQTDHAHTYTHTYTHAHT